MTAPFVDIRWLSVACALLLSACASDEFAARRARPGDLATIIDGLPREKDGVPICYPLGIFDDVTIDELSQMPPDFVASVYGRPCTRESTSALVLHVTSSSARGATSIHGLTCGDLQRAAESNEAQDVWVYIAGADAVNALMFAVAYDDDVDVTTWEPVVDALAIPSDDWPSSGSNLALAFNDCLVGEGPDRLQVIGRFVVRAGSSGTLRTIDPGSGPTGAPLAEIVDCRGRNQKYLLRTCAFGSVSIGPDAVPPPDAWTMRGERRVSAARSQVS